METRPVAGDKDAPVTPEIRGHPRESELLFATAGASYVSCLGVAALTRRGSRRGGPRRSYTRGYTDNCMHDSKGF